MKKLAVLTVFFVIFAVFVLPGALSFFVDIVPSTDQPSYSVDDRRSIYSTNSAMQLFTSTTDRLSGIGTTIGNPNLKNQKEIVFNLYEDNDLDTPIRTVIISGANIPDGYFMRFLFDPIIGSTGKKYAFTLSSPSAGADEVLYVYLTKSASEWMGDTYYQDELQEGKIPFVAYHTPESKMSLIKTIYGDWVKRILGI